MADLTVSLDDDLLHAAERIAASRNTTIAELTRTTHRGDAEAQRTACCPYAYDSIASSASRSAGEYGCLSPIAPTTPSHGEAATYVAASARSLTI